jgi:hypothetical protein
MSAETPAPKPTHHWVEGRYTRQDSTTFKARFRVAIEEGCPSSAQDKSGVEGALVEGSCIEVNRGCFIATAAFGSELDPHVKLLRSFRDDVLLQSDLRDSFSRVLDTYYHVSPPIAIAMMKSRTVKLFLRWIIVYPVLLFVKAFVALLKITHRTWMDKTPG